MSKPVRIYGAGGAGTNIAAKYLDVTDINFQPAVLDTSRANIEHFDDHNLDTYFVEGLNGSGKIRSENYEEIAPTIKEMLIQIPPAEFNIVVFSASGGSGSVIGPLILRELHERGIFAVAVMIGSYESMISAKNTKKTLQTLESFASMTGKPIVASYILNQPDKKRSEIDQSVLMTISSLGVLLGGDIREMDSKDVHNWAFFNKISGKAQLATLHIGLNERQIEAVTTPVSVASLYTDPDQSQPAVSSDYHTVGYTDLSAMEDGQQIHFLISTLSVRAIFDEIKAVTDRFEENNEARVDRESILHDAEKRDDGMVF